MADGLLVLDASAMVDMLIGSASAGAIVARLRDQDVHVPAHFDVEVLSAIGRLHRADRLTAQQAAERLDHVASLPFERHPVAALITGAWRRRASIRLADAVYIELGAQLDAPVLSTDGRLAAASSGVELVTSTG